MFDHVDREALHRIEEKVEKIMAGQQSIDNAVAVLGPFLSDLSTQVQAISAKLAAGGGAAVDTTALDTVIAQIPAAQAAVDALAAPAAAPVTA
jgi:hypothetical protein